LSTIATPQLEDELACRRDIQYLTSLGINTIVVANIRPSTNGETAACMEQLQKAGIYVLVGVGTLVYNIQARQAWDTDLMQSLTSVIDGYMVYDNVLGFYITGSPITLPFVRAAVRDLRNYVKSKGRAIPIGYLGRIRGRDFSDILSCGDQQSSVEFIAHDLGEDCIDPSNAGPIVKKVIADYHDYMVPSFLYSPQCNAGMAGNSSSFDFLAQPNITQVLSGAVVFSYFNYLRYDDFPGLCSWYTCISMSDIAQDWWI
jgi:hypothetical protein